MESRTISNYYIYKCEKIILNIREWPYEHVYPGIKKEKLPPKLPKGSKKRRRQLAERYDRNILYLIKRNLGERI